MVCRAINTVVLVVVLSLVPSMLSAQDDAAKLKELFEDDWEFFLQENPTFATSFGDTRYDDRLRGVSKQDQERRRDKTSSFLKRLEDINRDALDAGDRLNYDIYSRLRSTSIKESQFHTYLMPITNRSGFHVAFPELPDRLKFKTADDYRNYIARLNTFKKYTDDHIALMREGMEKGIVLPRIVLEGAEGAIEPHIVDDATESLLYKPFEDISDNIATADREELVKAGRAAVEESVVPAYRTFLEFMTKEYMPSARKTIAASDLPEFGRAFYEHRVKRFTTLDITPEEIHSLGHSEVKRIRAEMREIIDGVGFEGEFQDFVEFLRTDKRFYVDEPEDLMKEVAIVLKKMDGALPQLFGNLPRMPYGIKRVPDFIAPKTTTAYYNRPAGDGTRAGFYFVNTYDLPSRPLYEVEALSLHEAVPGHHLQIAIQQELEGIPNFRRFSGFTAFVEGWALYSERLGLEAGFYEDPYNNFGRLTYEMWRACRLVVDTGIHYLGWTRQQAIDFMAANTALTIHNITTEVDRYISWPGQALAYKMGELKIRELRALAEGDLGTKFDVRGFHDVVLGSGAVPLDVLEANVKNWIDQEKL